MHCRCHCHGHFLSWSLPLSWRRQWPRQWQRHCLPINAPMYFNVTCHTTDAMPWSLPRAMPPSVAAALLVQFLLSTGGAFLKHIRSRCTNKIFWTAKFGPHETRNISQSYGVKNSSTAWTVYAWLMSVTDRKIDRKTSWEQRHHLTMLHGQRCTGICQHHLQTTVGLLSKQDIQPDHCMAEVTEESTGQIHWYTCIT